MHPKLTTTLLLILALNTGWFVVYSVDLGLRGLSLQSAHQASRVFTEAGPVAVILLALHMIAGGLLSFAAPLQALPILRTRWRAAHRKLGYTLFALATLTGLGGLGYIGLEGTVGGPWMSVWFAIYGTLLVIAGANTVYHALARDMRRHFDWATRFVILAVGSWIYRMHYGLWDIATGGLATNAAFTGLFDRVQVVAFFVPYLLIAEVFLRR